MAGTITELLTAWKGGDRSVEPALVEHIYPMLRELARSQVRRNAGVMTLAATELAHEAYERLQRQQLVDWRNREHFLAIAATVTRRVVIDHLRRRSAEKRGGDQVVVAFEADSGDGIAADAPMLDWVALDQGLTQLGESDPACLRVAELRLFSGLSVEEIAEVMGSSTATVGRQWRFARVWLSERLGEAGSHGGVG